VPGTRVSIGSRIYTRVLSSAGAASWDVNDSVRARSVEVTPVNSELWTRNAVYARDGNMVTLWGMPDRRPGTTPPNGGSRLYSLPPEARANVDFVTDAICPLASFSRVARFPVEIRTDGAVIMYNIPDNGDQIWANTTHYFAVTYTAGN